MDNPRPRRRSLAAVALSLPSLLVALLALQPRALSAQEQAQPEPVEPLTTAAQIRALSPEIAAQHLPIRLRGCFMSGESHSFAMQDATDSIFFFTEHEALPFDQGDLIEVVGVTNPGDYAPCADATSIRLIGKTEIPEPIQTSIADLYLGQMDAKWVEITGIVRSAVILPNSIPKDYDKALKPATTPGVSSYTQMKIHDGNFELVAEVQEELDPRLFVDAKVRLRGNCFYLHNGNRQFVRPILHTPIRILPEIIEPPLPDDFDGPYRPVSSLLTFNPPGGNPEHRVHVRGVVTHQRLGKTLWIRDHAQSLRVQCTQEEALEPGDIVDVLGFPELGTYSPVLHDAKFRKRGEQTPLPPVELSQINMITRHDSDLVRLEARLVEVQRYPESIELTLKAFGTTVRSSLLTGPGPIEMPDWQPGSVVQVTGIASVGEGETAPLNGLWWSESLHVLLRSPTDLAVINPAPWWTPKRISYALAAVLAFAIGAIAVVVLLSRHRLREQKQQRAMAESEFSAILTERNRVAREIHDTLAQSIGAISVQLELARNTVETQADATRKHIKTAHMLARNAMTDARDSIWDMRSQVLEKYDLSGALERVATQLTEDTGISVSVDVTGDRRRLPPVVENNLLRIGQEAVTNACKHASPSRIDVQIAYQKRRVELVVTDDGVGFEPEHVPAESNRSFGLVGIRERVELLGGEIDIHSAKGKGTRIRVNVSD